MKETKAAIKALKEAIAEISKGTNYEAWKYAKKIEETTLAKYEAILKENNYKILAEAMKGLDT